MEFREGELIEQRLLQQKLFKRMEWFKDISVSAPLLEYQIFDKNIPILNIEHCGDHQYLYRLPKPSEIEKFAYDLHDQLSDKLKRKMDPMEIKISVETWIRDALLRAGVCKHNNLDEDVMRFIKNYDDIILSPDTNILLDCVVTSVLLPRIKEKIDEDIKGCPNWILIAIPKLVMNEVERKAIRRYRRDDFSAKVGWPSLDGRIGQRALQEILELDTNVNYKGVSIMTVGEIPQAFDSFKEDQTRWDAEIRFQIKDFISRISFHKGAFFLTQDRINAMMARAEGIQSLYLQKPEYEELIGKEMQNEDAGRVLYELAVTFGEINIKGICKLSIFWPEKHVSDWENSRVMINSTMI